jgi:predicted HicB family RNase H-like nuclease
MELSPYIESLQKSLQAASAPAGKEVAEAAVLLSSALEPAARLCLMEAMAEASDEITLALRDVAVEARLQGREIKFVVSEIDHAPTAPIPPGSAQAESSDDVARITLRLPESLKDSVEQAAGAENISVNGWLVRAISNALREHSDINHTSGRSRRGRSFKGFARS